MALPKSIRRLFFTTLANIAYYLLPKYRKIVHANLDFTFDNKLSSATKNAITRYSFKNLLFNFMHLMEMKKMTVDEFKQKVKVKNFEVVQQALETNKPIIYITPHYSAWELAGASLAVYAHPVTAVYKHLKNREYEAWLLSARSHFGNKNIEKNNVTKKLIKIVKNRDSIGILIDTNINKRDGLEVTFMGKSIHQTPVPAFLARKFDALIIPAVIRTDDDEHYELHFYNPIDVPKSEDEKRDIQEATQAQADWLSDVISKEPKFWFWLHKRFKDDHPEIYKNI